MSVDQILQKDTIVVFSKSYCPFCTKVKDLLNGLGQSYKVLELDLMGAEGVAIQEELKSKTKQGTVPNVFIRNHHIGGCDKTLALHADGTLTQMINGSYVWRDYDLIVIGGGSGGLAASKEAATLGKKVAVCDFVVPSPQGTTWGLGGTCVNVGCIPKKLMHTAALVGEILKEAPFFGWEQPPIVNHKWMDMISEVQDHIKSLNFGYRKSLLNQSVTYLNSYAQFCDPADPYKIRVSSKGKSTEITAHKFIIAVGGRPRYPNIPGAKEFGITSDDIFSLSYCPGKTLIVGASYIALECASFLTGIGLDVTVMIRSIVLRGFDQQMAEMIQGHLASHGTHFLQECIPQSIEKVSDGSPGLLKVTAKFSDGSVITNEYNTVLFAIGRDPCTKDLGLELVGVTTNTTNGKIICDQEDKTSAHHIFAIGDVVDGRMELTPLAIKAGQNLAKRLFSNHGVLTDYLFVPTTIFTSLEYGCVGMPEELATEKYGKDDIEVYHANFQPLEFQLSKRDEYVPYAKLICIKSEMERVIGLHVLGPNAGEIVQGFALALKLGAKKSDFSNLVGIHPTCAEVFTTMHITKSSGSALPKSSC